MEMGGSFSFESIMATTTSDNDESDKDDDAFLNDMILNPSVQAAVKNKRRKIKRRRQHLQERWRVEESRRRRRIGRQ